MSAQFLTDTLKILLIRAIRNTLTKNRAIIHATYDTYDTYLKVRQKIRGMFQWVARAASTSSNAKSPQERLLGPQ
jgi:hypothetical protein